MWTLKFWKQTAERAVKTFAQAAAAERAVKTFAQAAAGALAADGLGILSVDWIGVLSVAALSALLSVLTSVASAPLGDQESPSLLD